jgi:putative tryptophan/tyrosine transport system substrate-binding protein
MKRRAFIAALGAAAAWPVVARAQQAAMPVVGFIHIGTGRDSRIDAFYKGLSEVGFTDGNNVIVDFRPTPNPKGIPAQIADLVQKRVNVIAGQTPTALAAQSATRTIPIVACGGNDPIRDGLVASYNQPSGNITAVTIRAGDEPIKLLELLRDLLSSVTNVGMLIYPTKLTEEDAERVDTAAQTLGLKITLARAAVEDEFDLAFAHFAQAGVTAVLLEDNVYFDVRRSLLLMLARRHGLPAVSNNREFAVAGGLASYGANIDDVARNCGIYAGRILKGERPADLPVLQPTKFDLVINLKAAKTLGLTVPPSLLARADEVIE